MYLHVAALDEVDAALVAFVRRAELVADLARGAYNVVKLALDGSRISFLHYPGFFTDAFPALARTHVVDIAGSTTSSKSYADGSNPPILHRKETLLPAAHPDFRRFAELTAQAESFGLFEGAADIGTRVAWDARLAKLGLTISGHELVAAGPNAEREVAIQRHRTALTRYALSTPMQLLWRHGYLDGAYTVLDYGCGRGDDVAALRARGVAANGWDPHFAADEKRAPAEVVNLGFVLNVIENTKERAEAIRRAFDLTQRVLAVAVLIGGRTVYERHRLYRDGVLTQRGTFQKYFTQAEIRDYLATELARDPIALAPGVFFVFKDDEEEQRFLERRQRTAGIVGPMPAVPRERSIREPREPREPRARREPRPKALSKWETHAELIEAFYARTLELARQPEPDEFPRSAELRDHIGLPSTVLNRVLRERGTEELAGRQAARRRDMLVYLALNMFERRRSFGHLPESTRRDIKALWGAFGNAQTEAQALLFSVGKAEVIGAACRDAAVSGVGHLEADHDLQLHASLVPSLPPVLRVYIGCASRLYGEVDSADVVKIHLDSGKLSLMSYDDFEGKAVPMLIERVKVDMRRQDIAFFEYGPERPQALYLKSRLLHPSMEAFDAQTSFDQQLQALGIFDFSGFGPPVADFKRGLADAKLRVRGFELVARAKESSSHG